MSEKPVTPSAVDAAAAAIEAELAKLPSVSDMEKQIKELLSKKQELEKLQDLKINYGPGKPGKKQFNLPALPRGLGNISVNGEVMKGTKALTHAQFEEFNAVMSTRIELENKMRYGEGLAEQELKAFGSGGVTVARTGDTAKF